MIRVLAAIVLLAIIAVALRLKSRTPGISRPIKVSARATVSRGAVVAVVEVDGRRLLVGASAGQVNLLAELDETGGSRAVPGSPVTAVREDARPSSRIEPAPGAPTEVRPAGTFRPSTTGGSVVDRVRRLTVRTADPLARPAPFAGLAARRTPPSDLQPGLGT